MASFHPKAFNNNNNNNNNKVVWQTYNTHNKEKSKTFVKD